MKTKIFVYKGIVGIQSGPDAEGFIAKPGNGNLGCVLDASSVEISKEALDLLVKIPKGGGGLGEIDVFQSGDKIIIGWLGGYLKAFKPESIETSRDYNPGLLTHTDGVEVPNEFKEFIDSM
ncbi:MAG: hypothetical protein AABY15_00370 [Nanoarchaeota archaeon]